VPITYRWGIEGGRGGGPCIENLPWQFAHFNSAIAVALRAGTQIPRACLGTYGFVLWIRDSGGRDSADVVYHSLAELNHAPTASAGNPRVWQLGSGYRLREDVVLDGTASRDPDGDPLSYGWQVKGGPCAGNLPWQTQTFTEASAVALRARTVVPPNCVGQYLFRLTVTDSKGGVNSSDVQHRFEIVAPTLRIVLGPPSVVEFLKLGQEGVQLFVQEEAAEDAVPPDSYELEVTDDSGTLLGTVPVAAAEIAQHRVLWKGETKPGYGLGFGIFKLRVVARTEGLVLARSNEHAIRVVDFVVDIVGAIAVGERERPASTQPGSRQPDRSGPVQCGGGRPGSCA
jgi:hypothetical protein